MSTPRLYHRDQAGAPSISYANNRVADWAALTLILKACLIDGYSGRPAAGWTLEDEGSDFVVFRNGSQSGYFALVQEATQASLATVYLLYSYSGMSGGVPQGSGVKSGTAAGNSPPHKFNFAYFARAAEACSWALVADSRTFIISIASISITSPAELGLATGGYSASCSTLYVGEDSLGQFIACGHDMTTGTGTSAGAAKFDFSGFTALRYPDTGLLVDSASISVRTPGLAVVSVTNPVEGFFVLENCHLQPLSWGCNGVYGDFRGVCTDFRIALMSKSVAAQMLGFGEPLTTRNFNTPISLGDEYEYVVASGSGNNSRAMLLTTNPAFWESLG
ncbi:hypothetical protein ACFSB1_11085 [Halopseudomonas phragmitis]|uniref:hypothetical protein n=1 Tax=Halopseudomonas phragmitis TaxID=1931241 RepID=UPI0012BABD81|nr:hypothetical protein [Halopseudomonas phragmitis]